MFILNNNNINDFKDDYFNYNNQILSIDNYKNFTRIMIEGNKYYYFDPKNFKEINFENITIRNKVEFLEYKSIIIGTINKNFINLYNSKTYEKLNINDLDRHEKIIKLEKLNKNNIILRTNKNKYIIYNIKEFKINKLFKFNNNDKITNIIKLKNIIFIKKNDKEYLIYSIKDLNYIKLEGLKENIKIKKIVIFKKFFMVKQENNKYFYKIFILNLINFKEIKEKIIKIKEESSFIKIQGETRMYYYDKKTFLLNKNHSIPHIRKRKISEKKFYHEDGINNELLIKEGKFLELHERYIFIDKCKSGCKNKKDCSREHSPRKIKKKKKQIYLIKYDKNHYN